MRMGRRMRMRRRRRKKGGGGGRGGRRSWRQLQATAQKAIRPGHRPTNTLIHSNR